MGKVSIISKDDLLAGLEGKIKYWGTSAVRAGRRFYRGKTAGLKRSVGLQAPKVIGTRGTYNKNSKIIS